MYITALTIIEILQALLRLKLFTLFSLLVSLAQPFFSSQYEGTFSQLTTRSGLSQNTVYSIVQDINGFIWIGTKDGLNKYDGYEITPFYSSSDNPASLYDNEIQSIVALGDSVLLIGTLKGVNRLYLKDESIDRIKIINPSTNLPISALNMALDHNENLWIVYDFHLIKYSLTSQKTDYFILPSELKDINSLHIDADNNLWIACKDRVMFYNSRELKLEPFLINYKSILYTADNFYDLDSSKILLRNDQLFFSYNITDNSFHNFSENYPRISNIFLMSRDVVKYNKDTYYIGTIDNGLFEFNISNKSLKKIPYFFPGSTGNYNILNLIVDKQNNLWIGTNGGGLLYWNKNEKNFQLYNSLTHNLENKSIRGIYKQNEKSIWIGGYSGLEMIDLDQNSSIIFANKKDNKLDQAVRVIKPAPKNRDVLYIGFELGGIRRFNLKDQKYFPVEIDNYQKLKTKLGGVYSINFDSNEKIWIGSRNGLYIANNDLSDINMPDEFRSVFINHIYTDNDGAFWICSNNDGIFETDDQFSYIKQYNTYNSNISSDFILSATEDYEGSIWIGTNRGVNKLDKISGNIKVFDVKDGLPNNMVYGVLSDSLGNIWISTNRGIARINIQSEKIVNFGLNYNLQDREFNTGAFHNAYDGELFFGGIYGLNSFSPEAMETEKPFPNMKLTTLNLLGQMVEVHKSYDGKVILENKLAFTKEINFKHNQNTFSIGYTALEYFDDRNINYSYMLENYDNKWNDVKNRRIAPYSKVPPGEYVFKVKSTNSDGVWNRKYESLAIVINPPIWKTWYAYTFYILVILLFILGIFYLNQKKYSEKLKELEREKEIIEKLKRVDKLKNNFLAQISHEVRTPVNSILSFASLIKDDVKDKVDEELKFGFDSINISGKRIIRTIDLILNVSQVQTETYELKEIPLDLHSDILTLLISEHNLMAKSKGIVLSYENKAKNKTIIGDSYSITQIFANLIENAVKYTKTGEVKIILYEVNNKICVDVCDTGIGISKEFLPNLFDAFSQESEGYTREFEGNGLGLALVKKYCELNRAEISVISEKEVGSTFTVKFLS